MEPFHKELHHIMLKKGYKYMRILNLFSDKIDFYEKDGRTLEYHEDDYIVMTESNGQESPLYIFIQETDGIFDPGE